MRLNLIRLKLYGVTAILVLILIGIVLLFISTIPQIIIAIILGVSLNQSLKSGTNIYNQYKALKLESKR